MSTTKNFQAYKGMPTPVKARAAGKWDYRNVLVYTTENQDISVTMDNYDGLSMDYEKSYQSGDKVDFSNTVLPWKWDYSTALSTNRYCLMPKDGGSPAYVYNFDIIGSPTINSDTMVVSRFAAGNYIQINNTLSNINSFEIVIVLTTSSDVTTNQNYYSTSDSSINRCSLGLDQTHFRFFAGTSASSWDIANAVTGTYTVLPNTKYYIKFTFNGSRYTMYYSLDGETFIENCYVDSSLLIGDYTPNIGCRQNGLSPFLGSIDLSESYIKVNNTNWWVPTKTQQGTTYNNIITMDYDCNFDIIGSLNINGITKVVSGFGEKTNYIKIPTVFNAYNVDFEYCVKFNLTTINSRNKLIGSSDEVDTKLPTIQVNSSGHPGWSIPASSGSSWQSGDLYATDYDVLPNTWYWMKLVRSGNTYTLYMSTDGENWQDVQTYSGSDMYNNTQYHLAVGTDNYGSNAGLDSVTKGSIDLSETYIKINGSNWWVPSITEIAKQVPNVLNLSSSTNNKGIVSGFPTALESPETITLYKNKSFEGMFRAYTESSSNRTSNHFVSGSQFSQGGNMAFYVRSDSSSSYYYGVFKVNNAERYASFSLNYSTWYYFKVSYDPAIDTYIRWQYSTDGTTWNLLYSYDIGTYFLGDDPNATEMIITLYFGNQNYSSPFSGSIDFNNSYFKVDGQTVWNGMTNDNESLPGCTYNFTDDGSATTLNAFVVNNDQSIVLTPDNSYTNGYLLGTVSIPAHNVYSYNNGVWTDITPRQRFVATSASKIAYSDDGINWNEIENTSGYTSIVYGNGIFINYKYNQSNYLYSTDGVTWTSSTITGINNIRTICFANDMFIAIKSSTYNYYYSYNGVDWYDGTFPGQINEIYGAEDKFFAMWSNGQGGYMSSDGTNWTSFTLSNTSYGIVGVTKGNNKYIFNVYNDSSPYATTLYFYSTNGINWSASNLHSAKTWSSRFFNNKFIMTNGSSTDYEYSSDGINWTTSTLPINAGGKTVSDDKIIILTPSSTTTTTYAYSSDAINWLTGTLSSSQAWSGIACGTVI